MSSDRKKAIKIYLLAFFVPVILMIIVFALCGIWPIGINTVMTGDTTFQFVDYLSYLQSIIFGENDFTYSMSKNLGGEMAGFSAYYYFSPLNMLTLIFPSKWLPIGICLILILAPGLCSLSMCIILGKLYELEPFTLIFSYAYGLMAYIVVYNELFQYYTNFILLPIIFYGLIRLIRDQKLSLIYVVSLGAAIFNNYYTGYMICIFCLLYFIYEIILNGFSWKKAGIFAGASVLAAGLAAVTLIPAVLSLQGEKNVISLGLYLRMNPLDLFSKLYTGSFRGDFGAGLPNIYCGMAVTVLIIWYFFNRNISLRERVLTGLFLLFLILNFSINTLNVIWHGFNQPIGFPFRYAFLFSFFVIIKAYEGFLKLDGVPVKQAAISVAALFLAYSAFLIVKRIENTPLVSIVIDMVMIAVILTVLLRKPKQWMLFLILLEVADLGLNAKMSLDQFSFTELREYQEDIDRIGEAVSAVQSEDGSLYRMEKYFRRSNNDAMMFHYAGLSHFSSSEKQSTIRFMGDLGFRDNGNWAFYNNGNTAFTDSLLGVKYIISQYGTTGKPYKTVWKGDDTTVFKNPYALPLLFNCSPDVLNVQKKKGFDPFLFQMEIAGSITGSEEDILHELPVSIVKKTESVCQYEYSTDKDGIVEAYLYAPDMNSAHVLIDDYDIGEYFSTYQWGVLDLEHQKAGEHHTITVEVPEGEALPETELFICQEDYDKLERFYDTVMAKACSLEKKTSSIYTGKYKSDTGYLIFSVPYDTGWSAYVDNRSIPVSKAAGNLTAVNVPTGSHEIRLQFRSKGAGFGMTITCGSLLLLIAYLVVQKISEKS